MSSAMDACNVDRELLTAHQCKVDSREDETSLQPCSFPCACLADLGRSEHPSKPDQHCQYMEGQLAESTCIQM